ncbi:hypothetical protein LB526_11905 [Mesorhizobium sp. CA6]|uniref:hypothetical protein n=2 Tax=unclassified Mesorhizobium TaxID=325217 RepID=UPI001CC93ED2|nr:hypothetical protein [Mesorhizobium sp. CA6]MBZ9767462.1 hypothetical protein [Mesorhizobium sp. CA6]
MSSASAPSRNAMRRVIVTAMWIVAATCADAHDWYENKVDPVTNFKCCGGTDCRPIPESAVQSGADGGYVYLPDGFNIPPDRVQESPDGRYHICENHYVITNQPYLRCFFAPRLKVSRLLPR